MRNLTQTAIEVSTLDVQHVEAFTALTSPISFTAIAFDSERNVVFVTTECGADILVWRTSQPRTTTVSMSEFTFCGSYTSPTQDQTLPQRITLSLRVLAESNRLVLVARTGDIVFWALSDEGDFENDAEVQGSVEPGILAASWSPDNAFLALATRDNLVLMTVALDVLQETPLESSEFGEDAPIDVGWGSKETQFHGSIGRAHLHHPSPPAPTHTQDDSAHADADNDLPRITWRGDGAFFAVSTRSSSPTAQRAIRVYSSTGRLQSTSEHTQGLGACIAWRPNGGLIASTRNEDRPGGKDVHDVVFFERNGLRHGEFGLRWPTAKDGSVGFVKDLLWSPDSAVLAVWVVHTKENEGDTVQLWTTGNYHWYLKQEICMPGADRLTSAAWHPEHPLELVMTTASKLIVQTFAWETCEGASETGCVGVVDGDRILLTPFRVQNVPPPMSSHQLPLSAEPKAAALTASPLRRTPAHISLSPQYDVLVALWRTGRVAIWSLRTRDESAKGKPMDPILVWTEDLMSTGKVWRQVCVSVVDGILQLAMLASEEDGSDHVVILQVRLSAVDVVSPVHESWNIQLPGKNGRLVSDLDTAMPFWQTRDGDIHQVVLARNTTSLLCKFPAFCIWCACTLVQNKRLFVGLASGGKLYCIAAGSDVPLLVAGNVSSVTIAAGFVVFTTIAHEIQFAAVTALAVRIHASAEAMAQVKVGEQTSMPQEGPHTDALSTSQVGGEWERRRVERGSRIVTVVPGTMAVVLQMPRGNLETIAPRPLVMRVVRRDLDEGRWGKAFMACRKHRIDPSFLVEHNQAAFMASLPAFVEQIQDVDHINLFLTHIGRSKLPQNTVADVCDALRHELEERDLAKYVYAVLTAYVVKTPPDYESGLALLLRLRETQLVLVNDAVRYLIFLVDADRLFDTALGMYDFSLVLLIAQHAQKDPREYLPFLRELRALPEYRQRFRIDDHLRRHAKALSHLRVAGPDCFEEALEYVEQHRLYEKALAIWKEEDAEQQYKAILGAYGTWFFERHEYRQAALVFTQAQELRKAMVAHERAIAWQELFELATHVKLDTDAIVEIAYRVADELLSRKRFAEAARVLLDYADDVHQAISALVQGNELSEARRVIALRAVPALLEEVVAPGALELCAQLMDELGEMRETLQTQAGRLRELRVKKAQEPDAFYGTEDTALHNVDVMTDVSMVSAFTRYTTAPTSTSVASKMTKRNSKTKRKMERKIGSGRKGTVDEEEYLLRAVTKLVVRWGTVQASITKLLPHLAHLGPAHCTAGRSLQHDATTLQGEVRTTVDTIWTRADGSASAGGLGADGSKPTNGDSWAERMREVEKRKLLDALERVPKPEVPAFEGVWDSGLFWRIE